MKTRKVRNNRKFDCRNTSGFGDGVVDERIVEVFERKDADVVVGNEIAGAMACRQAVTRDADKLIDVKQVAKILDCSQRSVWRWASSNVIPRGVTIGGNIRWSYNSIMSWIAAEVQQADRMERTV